MAKLLGPDFISLQVRNFAASRTFYIEILGLAVDPRFDTPDFVLFDTNSIPFALSQAKVNLDEAPQPGLGVTLWIDCDHVDDLHAKRFDAELGADALEGPLENRLHLVDVLHRVGRHPSSLKGCVFVDRSSRRDPTAIRTFVLFLLLGLLP